MKRYAETVLQIAKQLKIISRDTLDILSYVNGCNSHLCQRMNGNVFIVSATETNSCLEVTKSILNDLKVCCDKGLQLNS